MLVLSYVLNINAQSFEFSTIDTTKFPSLSVEFQLVEKIEKTDIAIIENEQKLDFDFTIKTGKKAVFILMESSVLTHSKESNYAIQQIVTAITQLSKNKFPNTDFAFGIYNRSDANNVALKLISSKFQPISNQDIESINSLTKQSPASHKWTDLYKATYESLDWISKQTKEYASKQIIIIGTGKALSESPIKHADCIKKAKELHIQISTIGMESTDRYAFDNFNLLVEKNPESFIKADNSNVIETAITKYIQQINFNSYFIKFVTTAQKDGKEHKVIILIKDNKHTLTFVSPKTKSFLENYLHWIITTTAILVITIISIVVYRTKKKKKEAAIKLEKERAEAEKKANAMNERAMRNSNPDNTTFISSKPKRTATQITEPPSSITIINNGKAETIDIIKGITTFGRNNTNNIVIQNETVSGTHFTLEFTGLDCILSNISTSNGTIVNGVKVSKSNMYAGDKVKVGNVEILFK